MKKREITVKYTELRAALIGWVRYEGIYCVAVDDIRNTVFSGLNRGATAARIIGLKERDKLYEAPSDCSYKIETLYDAILKKIKGTWRIKFQLLYLMSEPDALAYIIRPLFSNPVAVVLHPDKNKVSVEYYTARTILSGLHMKRMIKYFGKMLPDNLVDIDKKEKEDGKK